MKHLFKAGAVCLFVLSARAQAAPMTLTLPPETATLKPSTLPGYAIARQQCMICHSADYIKFQPPSLSLAQWTGEASKMQHAYGAPITDQDVALVGAYLSVAYGGVKENELPVELRTQSAAASNAPGGTVDAQALLSANACLGCHAIDKKVVGPSYHDVAVKYRDDAGALGKLQDSIRQGSNGKWGNVAMPPFSQLKPDEIKALAEFVLRQ
jgi:cytochrome c551/c552